MRDKLEIAFLRAPPFPGGTRAMGHSSVRADAAGIADRGAVEDQVDAAISAIRAGRVGGPFWKRPSPSFAVVVRCEGEQILEAWRAKAHPGAALLVNRGASQKMQRKAAAVGFATVVDDIDYWTLLADAAEVHTSPTDELAWIAYLLGVTVIDHDGQVQTPDVLRAKLAANLFAHRFLDCFSDEAIPVDRAIDQLAFWRGLFDQTRSLASVTGITFWKRRQMSRLLWNGVASPAVASPAGALRRAISGKGALAVWPSRVSDRFLASAKRCKAEVWRVEDGFIRSIGLGSDLTLPLSIVVDRSGIYYDPSAPSDLETLLASHPFPASLLARARSLVTTIRQNRVSKYSTGLQRSQTAASLPADRRTVLAIGQVEDDLSVQRGGGGIKGNEEFLSRVRMEEPEAFVLYRPHPDVVAGHRPGHLDDATVFKYADAVDQTLNVVDLLERVDAVHVLSSLTGFEALIREREVFVHGQPFYSGWGLTRDLGPPCPRRGRQLSLEALVAATLILYPRYLDPVTGVLCGPEVIVARFAEGLAAQNSLMISLRRIQGSLRRRLTLAKAMS